MNDDARKYTLKMKYLYQEAIKNGGEVDVLDWLMLGMTFKRMNEEEVGY